MRRLPASSLVAAALGWAVAGQSQDPIHRRLTVEDGLPSNIIYNISQDHNGFLWFGSEVGVSRFDGHRFVNYGQREGLPDDEVLATFEDSRHRLWLLMLNGQLAFIQGDSVHHAGNDASLRGVTGRSGWARACEDRDGNVWFGGVWGELLRRRPDGSFQKIDPGTHNKFSGVVTPLLGPDGTVYIQVNDEGFRVEGGHLVPTFTFEGSTDHTAYAASPDGRLWAAAREGLIGLGRERGELILPADSCDHWDQVRSIAITADGTLICGRVDRGGVIVAPGGGGQRRIFEEVTINDVKLDDEGNCWFSTNGFGVFSIALDQLGSRILNEVNGTPLGTVSCLHTATDGRVWLGTESGRLVELREGKVVGEHDLRQGTMRVQRVRAMCSNADVLYAATDLLTMRLALDGREPPRTVGGWDRIRDRPIDRTPHKVLTLLHDGSIIGAFYDIGRVSDHADPRFRPYLADGLDLGRYHMVYEDRRHRLWVQRNDRLLRIEDGRIDTLAGLLDAPLTRITGMGALSDGTLVMGTLGQGVFILRNDTLVQRVRMSDGLLADRCNRVRLTGDTIVVATNAGAQVLIPRLSGRGAIPFTFLDPGTDRILVNDAILVNGQLFAATNDGLHITDALEHHKPQRAPRIHVSRITSRELSLPVDRYFQVEHDHRSIIVSMGAVSLTPGSALELQYRINDGQWTTSSTNDLALFIQEAGEYVLRLRARDPGSPWSPETEVSFAAIPPFWERSFFRLPAVLALAGLTFLALRGQARRRYRRRLQRLRQQEALIEERKRIAMDLHDDLGAELSGTAMLAEAALHGRQDAQHALADTIHRVRGMIPKVDEIIWALDSKNDRLSALFDQIERTAEARAQAIGVRFEYAAPWRFNDRVVTSDFRHVMLMLVKEAVTNALKHAQCDRLELVIEVEGDHLRILVMDNGRGMAGTSEAGHGHGFNNMRQRARRFHGTVEFTDVRPQGTCVTIDLVLPPSPGPGNTEGR